MEQIRSAVLFFQVRADQLPDLRSQRTLTNKDINGYHQSKYGIGNAGYG